jgi:hypothetical protein
MVSRSYSETAEKTPHTSFPPGVEVSTPTSIATSCQSALETSDEGDVLGGGHLQLALVDGVEQPPKGCCRIGDGVPAGTG